MLLLKVFIDISMYSYSIHKIRSVGINVRNVWHDYRCSWYV